MDIIAGLLEAKHASDPIQEMRDFLRELRISISGFNKVSPTRHSSALPVPKRLLYLFRGLALRGPFPMELCS